MGFKNKLKSLFSVDDEYEYEYVEEEIDTPQVSKTHKSDAQNVVNLTSMKQPTSKVVLCEPRTYNEAQEIADHVVNRRAVVINLERVDHMQAKRIVDFLSGTVYAVNGDIQKLGAQTFLCTPDNIEVTGTISESFVEDSEFEKGW
ncbi:MAG TPA: cell division protein SepF [Candidatus Dormibacteraeota bacterium]|nr:cell division protein SepF [Candidatus Dormibacteraeota bacterium]